MSAKYNNNNNNNNNNNSNNEALNRLFTTNSCTRDIAHKESATV